MLTRYAGWLVFLCAGMLPCTAPAAEAEHPLDAYNVVWESPSANSSGSMPLGNGDVGLNVWVEADGDLLFYVSKTDAFSGIGRLLKLGRVRVKLSPNPFAAGLPFVQTLELRQGRIEIVAGKDDSQVTLGVWVDANRPAIHVEAEGKREYELTASLEVWRTQPRTVTDRSEWHSVRGLMGAPFPVVVEPDTILETKPHRIAWHHRNETSIYPAVLKHQALESVLKPENDPLLHRTFGGIIEGEGLVKINATTLKSQQPKSRQAIRIYVLTQQTDTPEAWLAQLEQTVERVKATEVDRARAEHERWWADFWDRSWIRVTTSEHVFPESTKAKPLLSNKLPLRIGADSNAASRFSGDIDRAMVYARALSAEEIAEHAAGKMPQPGAAAGCVGDWTFDEPGDAATASAAPGNLPAKVVGKVEWVEGRTAGAKAIRLDGGGYLEVAHCEALDLETAVTLEAWIRPRSTAGRIIDKTQVAKANGYMIDTYPGNSLRLVVEDGNLSGDIRLAVDRWTHVVGLFDAVSGRKELYVDGKRAGEVESVQDADPRMRDPAYVVSRGYALQRFINACGGRGALADQVQRVDLHRRRGQARRRLPSMGRLLLVPEHAAGLLADAGLRRFRPDAPLFRMYLEALPLCEDRVRIYYDHGGAYFPETMYFWGTPANTDYGWNRGNTPPGLTQNSYIRYYWQGGLELIAMMLDHYAYTQDRRFLDETLLPLASAVLEFYDQHYPRDEQGKVLFSPAASLETWHAAVNPLPEIVGLGFVLPKMLDLPADAISDTQRADWKRLLSELPPIPAGKTDDGRTYLRRPESIPVAPTRRTPSCTRSSLIAATAWASRNWKWGG